MFAMATHRLPQRPLFIALESGTTGSGTSRITVNKPEGTIDDDILIFVHYSEDWDAFVTTKPSGFGTARGPGNATLDGAGRRIEVFAKLASSEGSNYVWDLFSSGGVNIYALLTYRHIDNVLRDQERNMATGSGTSHTMDSMASISADDSVRIVFCSVNRIGASSVVEPSFAYNFVKRLWLGGSIGFDDAGLLILEEPLNSDATIGSRLVETTNSCDVSHSQHVFSKLVL